MSRATPAGVKTAHRPRRSRLATGQRDGGQVRDPSVRSAGSLDGAVIWRQQQFRVEEVGIMDEHIIEIDQIEDGNVVLVVPLLRLIVMGRTLEEARVWARSAIG